MNNIYNQYNYDYGDVDDDSDKTNQTPAPLSGVGVSAAAATLAVPPGQRSGFNFQFAVPLQTRYDFSTPKTYAGQFLSRSAG